MWKTVCLRTGVMSCYYHLTDEETESYKLIDFPKVTHLRSSGVQIGILEVRLQTVSS